jgi:hypothetical protein
MAPAKNRMGNVGANPHFENFSTCARHYAGIIDALDLSPSNSRAMTGR